MNLYSNYFSSLKTVSSCLEMRDQLTNSGRVKEIKDQIVDSSSDEKKLLGKELNDLKNLIYNACDEKIIGIQKQQEKDNFTEFDPTFYSNKYESKNGNLHPITLITNEIIEIFGKMGFDVFFGDNIETQWYNFTLANSPEYHPSRDMQDTFWLDIKDKRDQNYVMKTQVTASAVKYAETHKPPFKVIFPGVVFRNENIDATHDINFHQFDMWLVDKSASISQLVTIIKDFFAVFFNDPDLKIRLRPSYFPFTQPSFEGDIYSSFIRGGKWVEVFGAGPIHTQVIKNMDLDPNQWQGIAFGFGIDRLAQLKLELSGISQFYNGHLSFLKGKD